MPEMKDSGIEWIGMIPSNWCTAKYKHFSKNRMGETILINDTVENGIPVYSATQDDKFLGYVENAKVILHNNDIVIPARGNSIGFAKIVHSDKATCTQTTICSTDIHDIEPKFLYYCCYGLKDYWFRYDGSAIPQITVSQVENNTLVLPPLEIQKSIANFLDKKCSEIDALTADIQSQIDILEEYKKSVITEAVTKGLNPDVEMKDSGIEWVGMIPKHWAIKRTKYIANSLSKGNGITKEQVFDDGDIQCVRYGEIYSKYEQSFDKTLSLTKLNQITSPKHIQYGDILFAGTGELIEEIGKNIVFLGTEPCLAGGDIVVLKHFQNPRFLNYALNSTYSQEQKSKGKAKLKVVHISATDIGNILITLPPIAEQDEIADFLDKTCSDIDLSIADKKTQLETLAEYKKSLIYEYVTGKKEVPADV